MARLAQDQEQPLGCASEKTNFREGARAQRSTWGSLCCRRLRGLLRGSGLLDCRYDGFGVHRTVMDWQGVSSGCQGGCALLDGDVPGIAGLLEFHCISLGGGKQTGPLGACWMNLALDNDSQKMRVVDVLKFTSKAL